jgi:transcriptional regulator NrdR family protein
MIQATKERNQVGAQTQVTCGCGRTGVHCPGCGAKTCYMLPSFSRMITLPANATANGEPQQIEIRSYNCRRCGARFSDIDRMECGAPQFISKDMRNRRKAFDALESLRELPERLATASGPAISRSELIKELFEIASGKRAGVCNANTNTGE